MKTLDQIQKELREKRAANSTLAALLENEKREMSDDELSQFETRKAEIEILEKEERKALATLEIRKLPGTESGPDGEEKELRKFDLAKAMNHVKRSAGSIDGFEKEMQAEAHKEMREANAGLTPNPQAVYIPMKVLRAIYSEEKRDVTTSTSGSGYGGYNIATELNGYVEALTEKSRLLQLGAGFITGVVGNIDYVQENAIFAPAFVAENGNSSESSPTYTKLQATPKRAAGFTDVSNQWLAQTSPEFQAKLWNQLTRGFAILADQVGTVGGGSNEPTGIIANSGVGAFYAGGAVDNSTNANGAAPAYQDAVNAYKVVGNNKGLTDNSRHLMSYDLSAKLMNTKIDAGSAAMVWMNEMVLGRTAKASTHVPNNLTKGTSSGVCSAWIFGDFTSVDFYQWGGIEMLNDPYTQAVAGLTRIHIAGYMDFAMYTPKSFAVGKDFLTT